MNIYIDPSIGWFVVGFVTGAALFVGLVLVSARRANAKAYEQKRAHHQEQMERVAAEMAPTPDKYKLPPFAGNLERTAGGTDRGRG